METLDFLKDVLRHRCATTTLPKQALSDAEYSAGFSILAQGTAYHEFIQPQLARLVASLVSARGANIAVLEIGPGPKSVLGALPGHLRRKVQKYVAFEPNGQFASKLQTWLGAPPKPFPCLADAATIHAVPFALDSHRAYVGSETTFDLVLFCHSMYGLRPKRQFIEQALALLAPQPASGIVAVFHRDGTLDLDGLVCHQTASFPTGVVAVADEDAVLDTFAQFIAGHTVQGDEVLRMRWRALCRSFGDYPSSWPGHVVFAEPTVMMTFNRGATALPELLNSVPSWEPGALMVKNREAQRHRAAAVMRPNSIDHVQRCVRWALKHGVGLTVIGGGHSGHCVWPNVVAVDMGLFDDVHFVVADADNDDADDAPPLIMAGAGCKTGDIIRQAMAAGLTVSLGSRPSVGAGLWLQGGIGHLARQYGLACDAIVGALVVSVASGEILCVGRVPRQHRPDHAVRPDNEQALLWALRGAGTNMGIVVSVALQASEAPMYCVRNWVLPISDDAGEDVRKLGEIEQLIARRLPRTSAADVYVYWDANQLHLGITVIDTGSANLAAVPFNDVLGREHSVRTVGGVGLFETEMYMAGMHGGHGGGKTSAFKRCVFLDDIGHDHVARLLTTAMDIRPSPLCYLHLLHGGGAVADVAAEATAFGCRDWHFACVITAVWPRHHDGTDVERTAVQWVYRVAMDLLPWSRGAYGADLGPDPRDQALAARAFGPNRLRLARLKKEFDPHNVLSYACPLPKPSTQPKLIVLVTGDCGAGKDYCAAIWASVFAQTQQEDLCRCFEVAVASISDVTKREYAAATGADLDRLLGDRAYKEQHRPALTAFFQDQVQQRQQLPEEHFLRVVHDDAVGVDVLFITGMREDAPVAALSHLVPYSRLIEVRVEASREVRQARRGCDDGDGDGDKPSTRRGVPCLVFDNSASADTGAVRRFGEHRLLPFVHTDLQRLAEMVRLVPDFPRPLIDFCHVLDIAQQPRGLTLCASLLRSHFAGDWATVGAIACCEAGGYVFASALAGRADVDVPLVLIRKAGKLPPPTISVAKPLSHISSSSTAASALEERIEMDRNAVPHGAKVVVVDDVLATGCTLCAVLRLLQKAGVAAEDISVMVVAEFPAHRGRDFLRRNRFGGVRVQSLLVFPGL